MDFGVQVNVYRTRWSDIAASVQAMETGAWDSVWFADHHIPPGGGGNAAEEAVHGPLPAVAPGAPHDELAALTNARLYTTK